MQDGRSCSTVADTGSGISAEQLPHIFEPGFSTRVRQSRAGPRGVPQDRRTAWRNDRGQNRPGVRGEVHPDLLR